MLLKTLIASFSLVATAALAACTSTGSTPTAGRWVPNVAGGGRQVGMTWQPDVPATQSTAQARTSEARPSGHWAPNTAAGGRTTGMVWVQD